MIPLPIPSIWLTIAAGGITIVLGIAYILQTRKIVREIKLVVTAHRRILTMALVSQGLALCFIGALIVTLAIIAPRGATSKTVTSMCAGMLLVFAIWTGSTGAQSDYFLLRVSHFVKIIAALMVLVGNMPE